MARRWPRRTLLSVLGLVAVVIVGWATYAVATWLSFDSPHEEATPSDILAARFMPRFEVAERHRTTVDAPHGLVFATAQEMSLEDSPVIRAIFRGREVLMRSDVTADTLPRALIAQMQSLGWGILAHDPGREIVLGAVTKPWEPDVGFRALPPERYAAFDSAGWAKIVVVFAADSLAPGRSRFRTETRVLTTDPQSRARFRRYWSVFSPGIILIRYESLRIVRREAERRVAAGR
jgi:hypothetical protein